MEAKGQILVARGKTASHMRYFAISIFLTIGQTVNILMEHAHDFVNGHYDHNAKVAAK